MKIVTSTSPTRIERQQYCIKSWVKYGYEIIALQPPNQIQSARANFPDITVIESTNTGIELNKPYHVQVCEHIQLANKYNDTILLINSDIEMTYSIDEFNYWIDVQDNIFKIGIRWNHIEREANLCPYGIDAFQITPIIANIMPNLGFVIGCPHWDYWIVYHLLKNNYSISANKSMRLFHELHENRWTKADYNNTAKLFNDNHDIDNNQLSREIANVTDRGNYIASLKGRRVLV